MGFWGVLGALWVYDHIIPDVALAPDRDYDYYDDEPRRIPTYRAVDPDIVMHECLLEAMAEIVYDPDEPYEHRVALAEELGLPAPPYPLSGATDCAVEEIYEC